MTSIQIDVNNPAFLEHWFGLPGADALRVLQMLKKISRLSWEQLYADPGLRWEAVQSRPGPRGQKLYSLRVTQKVRAVGYRDGNVLRLLTLHPDQDSAYH